MPKKQIVSNKGIRIGKDANTLLNLLIGANNSNAVKCEIEKIDYLQEHLEEIDIITDLSLYKGKTQLWKYILTETDYMVGTVPVYLSANSNGTINKERLYDSICEQCENGVSIITIHPTVNWKLLEMGKDRIIPCTSRGGGIVTRDLICNKSDENVYVQLLDKIARKCQENKTIISIGSTFRSGTILDALDSIYLEELREQIKISDYLDGIGVDALIETPGHIDARKLLELAKMLEQVKHPIMPLGPMLTDVGFEEDDTVAVIGASLMGVNNCADILSIVTSREHLSGIPTIDDMKRAISKYKVTKHIIDLYKTNDNSQDLQISLERAKNKSCNAASGVECDRCKNVCPLRIFNI